MKYIIPQEKLNKIVFRYLDNKLLNKLEKYRPKYYDGIVYKLPNEEFGLLGWKKPDTLYVYYELIDEISDFFSLDSVDSEEIIGKWAGDRLQIEVKDTRAAVKEPTTMAGDRLQIEVKDTFIDFSITPYTAEDRLQIEVKDTHKYFYNNTQSRNRGANNKTINEMINPNLVRIKRRSHIIDDEFRRVISGNYIKQLCTSNAQKFLESVSRQVVENLYWHTFHEMDDTTEEWAVIYYYIINYVENKYKDEINNLHHINCGD